MYIFIDINFPQKNNAINESTNSIMKITKTKTVEGLQLSPMIVTFLCHEKNPISY